MDNLTLFLNSFLSYLLVFFVFGITIFVACKIGIGLRKSKNAKEAGEEAQDNGKSAQE